MSRIRILTDQVANQIAAGEVIERPASAVKELLENALDAGATRIEVEFRRGGRSLIRVEDNGRGMDREDALLAFERHGTSKLVDVADLQRLATFGFRGEALPSIASISRCTLQTRAEGSESGTEVVVDAGKVGPVRDCGRPPGTRIEVEHLFHSVPARRKFLKSDRTESAHIAQCVRLYALASPKVAFTLIEDGRPVFRSPPCPSLAERVGEIFGPQLAATLVPVASEEGALRLEGLIGRPGTDRVTRHETICFVNGRPVDSRTLYLALSESTRDTVPRGRHLPAFLFLRCPSAAVDVNVHPAKREVRFRDELAVRAFLVRSLLGRLRDASPAGPAPEPPARDAGGAFWPAPPPGAPVLRLEEEASPRGGASLPTAPGWRPLGVAHQAYAVFETPAGIVVIDRRAAHERIWFERLREEMGSGPAPSQRLLLPASLEVDPIAAALLRERAPLLRAAGFEVAEFGRQFFRIEAVPEWMEPADAEPFLRDVLGALRDGSIEAEDSAAGREQFAQLAAARGVRLNPHPGEEELQALAGQLFSTRSPLTSPSGRPTCLELGQAELARRFGR